MSEMNAKAHNAAEKWNEVWKKAQETDWRADILAPVYNRIAELLPARAKVIDIGGGTGTLALKLLGREPYSAAALAYLADPKNVALSVEVAAEVGWRGLRRGNGREVEVWEHNEAALAACSVQDVPSRRVDLEDPVRLASGYNQLLSFGRAIVSTEVLEHLSDNALDDVMRMALSSKQPCFFSVPNDRLGPDEEPEHARKWTAKSFLDFLRSYDPDARVEVLGQPWHNSTYASRGQPCFLLGIMGMPKKSRLSVCWPARDEAADIEKCLASYRGVADELIVGIDPRTKDNTRELAEKYADVVFELTELRGPPDDQTPEGGFHFAHARNQCMDRCTSPWIFMTEAHEPLVEGKDALLHLELIPDEAVVVNVVRQGGPPWKREQWLFPWLCRNRPDIRYTRSTHNTLVYPDNVQVVTLPQVKTLHERVHAATIARKNQRTVQNRVKLMEDWISNGNTWSLQYLGSEWRDHDPEKAVHYLREHIAIEKFGTLRYNTRLILARTLAEMERVDEAVEVLQGAAGDDWTRTEHFIYLGDLAAHGEEYEKALTFYLYAATKRSKAPLITLWVDLAFYSWLPAQRLAHSYAALGMLPEALYWAREVLSDFQSFGDEAPAAYIEEAQQNITLIEEAIHGRSVEDRAAAE